MLSIVDKGIDKGKEMLDSKFFKEIGKKGGKASAESEEHYKPTPEKAAEMGKKSKRPKGATLPVAPFLLEGDQSKYLDGITRRATNEKAV